MKTAGSMLIDLTEAVYDLEKEDAAWVPDLLATARPFLDHGLGIAAATYSLAPDAAAPVVHQKFSAGGVPDLQARSSRVEAEWPREVFVELMRPGHVSTLSEVAAKHPIVLEAYARHFDGVRDVFGITAVDPNGLGLLLVALLPEVTTLKGRELRLWRMMGAHLAAGHRLRRGLSGRDAGSDLPHGAEAVIDPTHARLTDAAGEGKTRDAASALREAAVRIDRARGSARSADPAEALAMWKALTDGRWSLVDWFDTDGRRFVLALPNAPEVTDPRGLSERESMVATYAMHGDTVTLIGYRLGLSKGTVSATLKRAMRKLKVKNQAQLIERFSALANACEG